jgi:hypothetical protein
METTPVEIAWKVQFKMSWCNSCTYVCVRSYDCKICLVNFYLYKFEIVYNGGGFYGKVLGGSTQLSVEGLVCLNVVQYFGSAARNFVFVLKLVTSKFRIYLPKLNLNA